jgi:tetratricopeptide (TPR) repeat protein
MRVGRYEIVAAIGRGGTGAVFSARAPGGEPVAIKVLHRTSAALVARFDRERRLLESLGAAEGFVPLLDFGTTGDGPFIVMPLLPGGTLREKLAAGPLTVEGTIELGNALARALGAAHARGIVHRDVKPENVLFTADGRALIADLGLAKHFDSGVPGASQSVSLSREGSFRGTAGYMAPEQMVDAKGVSPAVDVFAVGAILYECLAGVPPFVGENILELLSRVEAGAFAPLRSRRADAPPWLVAAIERALSTAARDRFASAIELARALRAGESGGAPVSRRALAGVSLVVLLALALGLALAPSAAPVSKPPARPRTKPELPAGVDEHLARANELFVKGDCAGAIAEATRAIAIAPADPLAYCDRAIARGGAGDFAGMIADSTKATELDPKLAWAWACRGSAKESSDDTGGALADLMKATELDPKLAWAWACRATVWRRRSDWDRTCADATRALELDGSIRSALDDRGTAREGLGDEPGAIEDYERFLQISASDARAADVRAKLERLRHARAEPR